MIVEKTTKMSRCPDCGHSGIGVTCSETNLWVNCRRCQCSTSKFEIVRGGWDAHYQLSELAIKEWNESCEAKSGVNIRKVVSQSVLPV